MEIHWYEKKGNVKADNGAAKDTSNARKAAEGEGEGLGSRGRGSGGWGFQGGSRVSRVLIG